MQGWDAISQHYAAAVLHVLASSAWQTTVRTGSQLWGCDGKREGGGGAMFFFHKTALQNG